MPLDSSEEDIRGPESTALEIGGIPGQFEKTRDHLRQLKTYTLDLQEAVQFLNLDPTQSRQSLRYDRGN